MTESATPAALLALKEISLSYGKRKILDAIDLDIESGSFTVIAGESGSGKSVTGLSLLRLHATLRAATKKRKPASFATP